MSKDEVRKNWKYGLRVFLVYLALVLVVGVISSRIRGIDWSAIRYAYGSWVVWIAILIPGIVAVLVNLITPRVFIPLSTIILAGFLLVAGLQGFESLGGAVKGVGDLELLSLGAAVFAIGLGFLGLYGKPSDTADGVKGIRADLSKMGTAVRRLNKSVKGLDSRITGLQSDKGRGSARKQR